MQSLEGNHIWGTRRIYYGTLFINIFQRNLFFIINKTDFASYAYDNTPSRTANTIDEGIQSLKPDCMLLFKLFSDNQSDNQVKVYQVGGWQRDLGLFNNFFRNKKVHMSTSNSRDKMFSLTKKLVLQNLIFFKYKG